MSDFLFRGSLADIDIDVHNLTQIEAERQYRRLILIPSESTSPIAVRQALSTAFHNIYAEGYPDESSRRQTEDDILDLETNLAHYRRYSDPRYYKGVEYADTVEALARRRCAEAFATKEIPADDLYVNVQALSGAPANNAVYHALVNPGDTVMGMDLLHGGHLTHGSPANRTGKLYNIVHYTVSPETEKIDYNQVEALALEHKPRMIIAGFSSYPWQVDWKRFREIADQVGAYLLADISHVAGLVVGGVYPSPVGYADVITTTTHKTLGGPRGAVILTTNRLLSRKIDRAVFPGEQGGPHVNVFAALAVAFKFAQSAEFSKLQAQTVKNCIAFTNRFEERGIRVPFGGTDTHVMNLDMKSIKGQDGAALSGDQASRILDLAGIVVNRNTIPGDRSAFNPSGIRMGTPWITQRGFDVKDSIALADLITDLLQGSAPYRQASTRRYKSRAKLEFELLEQTKIKVRDLALKKGIDFDPPQHGYPHFYYLDDNPDAKQDRAAYDLRGESVDVFLNFVLSSDVESLGNGQVQPAKLFADGQEIEGVLRKVGDRHFRLSLPVKQASLAANWLRGLSDGFIKFDPDDLLKKIPGPVVVAPSKEDPDPPAKGSDVDETKPYYIGNKLGKGKALPEFTWKEPEEGKPQTTALNKTHREMGAKMVPFAGWDMPVWYSSVVEEHIAVRQAAGLFDVSHMGVYQAEGPDAAAFLDTVCSNHIGSLDVGDSLYSHFLDPDANVIDDLLVYRRAADKYLVVVNASNDDKDWAWLNAVRDGKALIDRERPWARGFGRNVTLRNLRDPEAGADMRVDIALQGPKSREILLALGCDDQTRKRVLKLRRTQLCEATIGGFNLVVSRTGYTGAPMSFELFVHPDKSPDLWNALIKTGEPLGLKPCGLGARDSLRTEAGLPLYGHEMGGELNFGVAEAGFRTYVKTHKPWFIGREAFLAREAQRTGVVVRFRFNEKGVRMAHLGDPVLDKRGKTIGLVTSCAIDRFGSLTGLAFVDRKNAVKGTPLHIFQSASEKAGKAPASLKTGDKVSIPTSAVVLSRFPKL